MFQMCFRLHHSASRTPGKAQGRVKVIGLGLEWRKVGQANARGRFSVTVELGWRKVGSANDRRYGKGFSLNS